MASENEPAKLLLPYLQRADELQKHEPLISYYCRLYAMERGLKIPQAERTKTTNALLVSLMKQLEKDKISLKLTPDDSLHIEGFALNVFARADKQDRSGRADLNTAKTFYAASIFFEILNQFGPLQPDLEQKQKYAVWKAADIRKALKEGRKPVPGPPGGDEDLSIPSSSPSSANDLWPNETTVSSPRPEPDASPKFYNKSSNLPSAHISPPPKFIDKTNNPSSFTNIPPPQFHDEVNNSQHPENTPTANYPSHDYQPPPPTNESESSSYSQQYLPQSYPQGHQQHIPHNYPLPPSQDASSSFSYPHFQSYPSFTEASLPSIPTHYPSYYQGSDSTSFSPHSMPPSANYSSDSRYHSISRDGPVSEPEKIAPTSSSSLFQYDSNYQPPPEKIAEAHKAARFAVGALAFDDVSVAIEFLKKSLEMLTNPSAGQ